VARHLADHDRPDELFVEETLCRLLFRTLREVWRRTMGSGSIRPSTDRHHHELVQATRAVLCRTYADRDSLSTIARQVHTSAFHLARIFRARTGLSIHAYRHQLRLRASLERLTEPRTDLTHLAIDLGYCSHAHFTDTFRGVFGIPPSVVRRSLAEDRLRELSTIVEA
jgi:AraC-like DNA-binding protein